MEGRCGLVKADDVQLEQHCEAKAKDSTYARDTCAKVLEMSLQKLGVEKLSKDDVQKMQWEVLEAKIGSWIHFTRIDVKTLFAGQHIISDQIFEDMHSGQFILLKLTKKV